MLARLSWVWVPFILILLAVHVALAAWRWSVIETCLGGHKPEFRLAFGSGAIATGLGTFLPAPLMNVACRSLANKFSGASAGRGALSGTIDQGSDFAVSLWLAIPAGLAMLQGDVHIYFWGAPLMALVGFAGLLTLKRAWALWQSFRPVKNAAKLGGLLSTKSLLRIYLLSIIRLLNLTVITIAVGLTSGAASASTLAVAVPLVSIATAVAMLPGSIGVSEWSFSAVLQQLHVEPHTIVVFVLANRLLLTMLPIILGLLTVLVMLIRSGRSASKTVP